MLKRYVERNSNGIGFLTMEEFCHMARMSNETLEQLGPGIQWEESYVTDNKLFCIYLAEDERLIWDHARKMNIPIDHVSEIKRSIDPTTATLADAPYYPRDEDIYDSIL